MWQSRLDLQQDQMWRSQSEQNVIMSDHSAEYRLFEDPVYLMQYNLLWPNLPDNRAVNVENSAFLTAENEVYLRKV